MTASAPAPIATVTADRLTHLLMFIVLPSLFAAGMKSAARRPRITLADPFTVCETNNGLALILVAVCTSV
jgi:hypothetical protein